MPCPSLALRASVLPNRPRLGQMVLDKKKPGFLPKTGPSGRGASSIRSSPLQQGGEVQIGKTPALVRRREMHLTEDPRSHPDRVDVHALDDRVRAYQLRQLREQLLLVFIAKAPAHRSGIEELPF